MTSECHPEEALDRATAGLLSVDERQELDRHLAMCPACAAQISMSKRRAETLAPQPWDASLNQRAVEAALAELQRPRLRWWPRRLTLAFSLLVLLVAGVAGAAVWLGSTPKSLPTPMPAPMPAPIAVPPSPAEPDPTPAAVPAPAPAPAAPAERAVRPPRPQPSAAALFEEALALRRSGKIEAALEVFTHLQRVYPGARETRLSFALAGWSLLNRKRPDRALVQFEQYLANEGEADEEAQAGRAIAFGMLGRTADETQAWQLLIARHPDSVHAARARERLKQLHDKGTRP